MILDPEYLDRIYTEWLIQRRRELELDFVPSYWDRRASYQGEYRNRPVNQTFENWLFAQGFTVIQREGKRYLKFSGDKKRLTWFLLKHGTTV